MAFAKTLLEKGGSTICLGRDPRPHGERLADAFCRGAESAGAMVMYTGLATTPSMYEFCRWVQCFVFVCSDCTDVSCFVGLVNVMLQSWVSAHTCLICELD